MLNSKFKTNRHGKKYKDNKSNKLDHIKKNNHKTVNFNLNLNLIYLYSKVEKYRIIQIAQNNKVSHHHQ
jgi:hypothetical protein